MARLQIDLTLEAVENMTTEDIAKLSKMMRRRVNEMLEKLSAKKKAEEKTERLRLTNIEKERKRMEGVEKKKLEKENQMKKDDERHRLMSEEVAKMSKVMSTVAVIEKPTSEKRKSLPFHKALAKFLTENPSFRCSLPSADAIRLDRLSSMPTSELANILIHNGFSFKPPHRPDYVINEVLGRKPRENPYNYFYDDRQAIDYHGIMEKSSLEDKIFFMLAILVSKGDIKYVNGFSCAEPVDMCVLIFRFMVNIKKFIVANCIPWRETRFLDIIKAIEEPKGRMLRLGESIFQDLTSYVEELKRDYKEGCDSLQLKNAHELAQQFLVDEDSPTWLPLVPKDERAAIAMFSDEMFEMCSQGIQKSTSSSRELRTADYSPIFVQNAKALQSFLTDKLIVNV